MSIENTETFGNYLIHGIDEIILPEAVSMWPSAPGWKVLSIIILLWVLYRTVNWIKYTWRNRYRGEVLRQIDKIQKQSENDINSVISILPHYLKVTALQAYPRHDVASLSGNEWLIFLDLHYAGPSFSKSVGKKLLTISYLPQEQWQISKEESRTLIKMSRQWIKKHKEAIDV